MAPREGCSSPGPGPQDRRTTVDEPRVAQVAHDDQDREDRPCYCYGGYHYIGYEEGGEEHVAVVPCKRCKQAR